jgi:hypothetical protein
MAAGRLLLAVFGYLGAVCTSSTSSAQQPGVGLPARGFEIGVRGSLGMPAGRMGKLLSRDGMVRARSPADLIFAGVGLTLDAGYRVWPAYYVGVELRWTTLALNDSSIPGCDKAARMPEPRARDCYGRQYQVGLSVIRYFDYEPGQPGPWLGLGVAWQRIAIHKDDVGVENVGTENLVTALDGVELLAVKVGFDKRIVGGLQFSPFLDASVAWLFTHGESKTANGETEKTASPLEGGFPHIWLVVGVRFVFAQGR